MLDQCLTRSETQRTHLIASRPFTLDKIHLFSFNQVDTRYFGFETFNLGMNHHSKNLQSVYAESN